MSAELQWIILVLFLISKNVGYFFLQINTALRKIFLVFMIFRKINHNQIIILIYLCKSLILIEAKRNLFGYLILQRISYEMQVFQMWYHLPYQFIHKILKIWIFICKLSTFGGFHIAILLYYNSDMSQQDGQKLGCENVTHLAMNTSFIGFPFLYLGNILNPFVCLDCIIFIYNIRDQRYFR